MSFEDLWNRWLVTEAKAVAAAQAEAVRQTGELRANAEAARKHLRNEQELLWKAEAEMRRLGDAIVGVNPATPGWDAVLPAFMRARGAVAAFELRLERAAKVLQSAEHMATTYTPFPMPAPPVVLAQGDGWAK